MANNPPADPTKALTDRVAQLEAANAKLKGDLQAAASDIASSLKSNADLKAELDATGKKLAQVVAENAKLSKGGASKTPAHGARTSFADRPWAKLYVDREETADGPTNASDANDLGEPTNATK